MLSILPPRQLSSGYEHHYGLTLRPFSPTLDQRFVYPCVSYARTVAEVRLALQQREGLVVITGGIGTGKTMLCRTLLQRLDTPVYVSVVLDPCLTVEELLWHVLTDFGVVAADLQLGNGRRRMPVRHRLVAALQRFLASLASSGSYAVVVIDEAQHLRPAVLEQIRLLLNLETDEAKLLQVVLVGQPELDRLLRRPEMRQLDQRIARRCELLPLAAHEVKGYIERRLSIAQRLALRDETESLQCRDSDMDVASWSVSFTPSAMRAVVARSRGIPRLINLLCDRALEIGCHHQTHTIDARIVRAAARRMDSGTRPSSRIRMMRAAAAVAAMVGVLAGGSALSWAGRPVIQPVAALPAPPQTFANASDPAHREWTAVGPMALRELAVADSFNITVVSFKAASRASAVVAQLEASGLPASIRTAVRDGPWHQVIVGPYISEADAATGQQRLASFGYPHTEISVEHAQGVEPARDWSAPGPAVARVGVSQP